MAIFEFLDSLLRGTSTQTGRVGDTETVRKIVDLLEGVSPERARFLAAFAYLMARVAHADFNVSAEEMAKMREILESRGGLPSSQAAAVAALAKHQSVHEGSTEDFLVTREFKRIATRDEMLQLLDCLFALSSAHENVSVVEDNAIRQIASELSLEHHEFILIRSRYRDQLEIFQMGDKSTQDAEQE